MIEQYVTLSTERRAASTPRVTPTALPLDTCRSWRLISLRLASFKRRVRRSYAHSRALAHKQASQEGTSRCPECGPPSERPLSAAPKPAVGPIHVPIPGTRPCAARRGTCASALRRARRKGRLRCFALCQAQAMLPARVTAAAYRARQRVQPDAFGCHGCEGSPPAQLRLRQGVAGEEPSFCPCSERVSGGKRSSPAAPRRGLVTRCTTASRRRRV